MRPASHRGATVISRFSGTTQQWRLKARLVGFTGEVRVGQGSTTYTLLSLHLSGLGDICFPGVIKKREFKLCVV